MPRSDAPKHKTGSATTDAQWRAIVHADLHRDAGIRDPTCLLCWPPPRPARASRSAWRTTEEAAPPEPPEEATEPPRPARAPRGPWRTTEATEEATSPEPPEEATEPQDTAELPPTYTDATRSRRSTGSNASYDSDLRSTSPNEETQRQMGKMQLDLRLLAARQRRTELQACKDRLRQKRERKEFDCALEAVDRVSARALKAVALTLTFVFLCALLPGADAALTIEDRQLKAFDCTQPQGLTATTRSPPQECEDLDPQVDADVNATYILLQKVDEYSVKGFRCRKWLSSMGHYCGTYSHQTFAPGLAAIKVPQTVTQMECAQWAKTHSMMHHGRKVAVPVGFKTNNLEVLGTTFFTSNDVTCRGETWTQGNAEKTKRPRMNIWHQLDTLLEEVDISVLDDNTMIVEQTGERIPCPPEERGCYTGYVGGAFVWELPAPSEHCEYYKTKVVTGRDVMTAGTTVFMSTDGSHVRLTHNGGTRIVCGGEVRLTDYPNLALIPIGGGNELLLRPLPAKHVSIATYSNNKDDYLYHAATTHMQTELKSVVQQQCQQQRKGRDAPPAAMAAEQAAVHDGSTAYLGGGWFSTAAGEAWYRYRCRAISVTLKDTDGCFTNFPVDLTKADREQYVLAHLPPKARRSRYRRSAAADEPRLRRKGETDDEAAVRERDEDAEYERVERETVRLESQQLYLEPGTRRVVTLTAPTPCSSLFAQMVRNRLGEWVNLIEGRAEKGLPPAVVEEPLYFAPDAGAWIMTNFSHSGVYSHETIEASEKFQRYPVQKSITVGILANGDRTGGAPSGSYSPGDLFGEFSGISFNFSGPFIWFVDNFGRMITFIILIFTCIKCCTYFVEVINCMIQMWKEGAGWLYLLTAFLPSVATTVLVKLTRSNVPVPDAPDSKSGGSSRSDDVEAQLGPYSAKKDIRAAAKRKGVSYRKLRKELKKLRKKQLAEIKEVDEKDPWKDSK
jgi:hypothetical protein